MFKLQLLSEAELQLILYLILCLELEDKGLVMQSDEIMFLWPVAELSQRGGVVR